MDRLQEESVDDPAAVQHVGQQQQAPLQQQQPASLTLQQQAPLQQQQQPFIQQQQQAPLQQQPASLTLQQQPFIQQQQQAPLQQQPASLTLQQQPFIQQQQQAPLQQQPAQLTLQQQQFMQQQQPALQQQPAQLTLQQQPFMQQQQQQQPALFQQQQPAALQQQPALQQPGALVQAQHQQAQWLPYQMQQQQPQWQQPAWNQQSLSSPPPAPAGAWSSMQFCSPLSNSPQACGSPTPGNPSFFLNSPRHQYNLRSQLSNTLNFSDLRSQLAARVTLPWEKRLGRGRPNITETALKNMYELGLIAPGPSAGQTGQQAPMFLPQAAGAGSPLAANSAQQVYLPAQSGPCVAMGYQPLIPSQPNSLPMMLPATSSSLPGTGSAAPSQPSAATFQPYPGTSTAGAPPGHHSDSDKSCVVCRGDQPNGLLVCGHHICKLCFDQQLVTKPECPSPRCSQILTADSFILFKRT